MEIFLDTAKLDEIKFWLKQGVIDGVATNPSIFVKEGIAEDEAHIRAIAELVKPRPVNVQVSAVSPTEILAQAQQFVRWAKNIVVKVPVISENGEPLLHVVRELSRAGYRVNSTACLSFGQVALAVKAGASYASIFFGRVADEGHDAAKLIRESTGWLREWNYSTKIVVGSVRETWYIQEAALAGAHVIAIPPAVLRKWVDHQYTRATVRQFNADARKASKNSNHRGKGLTGQRLNPQRLAK